MSDPNSEQPISQRALVTRKAVGLAADAAWSHLVPLPLARGVFVGACLGTALITFFGGLLLLWLFIGIARLPGEVGQGFGAGATTAIQQTEHAVGAAVQVLRDARDPYHPPRYAIAQDVEIDQLTVIDAGQLLGRSAADTFTVTGVFRRAAGSSGHALRYAKVHRELKVPKVTKILGITVHTDRGAAEYALYRGELFGIAHRYYRVNWLSLARQEVAIIRLRRPGEGTGPLVFDAP